MLEHPEYQVHLVNEDDQAHRAYLDNEAIKARMEILAQQAYPAAPGQLADLVCQVYPATRAPLAIPAPPAILDIPAAQLLAADTSCLDIRRPPKCHNVQLAPIKCGMDIRYCTSWAMESHLDKIWACLAAAYAVSRPSHSCRAI